MRQSVSITGFSTEAFGQAIESITLIHAIFSRVFKDGILEHWQPSTFAEHPVIDTSNRYFASRHQNPSAKSLAFHHLVDPNGILTNIAVGDLIHTEENDVKHFEWYTNDDDNREK
jgi:hypothetical protein